MGGGEAPVPRVGGAPLPWRGTAGLLRHRALCSRLAASAASAASSAHRSRAATGPSASTGGTPPAGAPPPGACSIRLAASCMQLSARTWPPARRANSSSADESLSLWRAAPPWGRRLGTSPASPSALHSRPPLCGAAPPGAWGRGVSAEAGSRSSSSSASRAAPPSPPPMLGVSPPPAAAPPSRLPSVQSPSPAGIPVGCQISTLSRATSRLATSKCVRASASVPRLGTQPAGPAAPSSPSPRQRPALLSAAAAAAAAVACSLPSPSHLSAPPTWTSCQQAATRSSSSRTASGMRTSCRGRLGARGLPERAVGRAASTQATAGWRARCASPLPSTRRHSLPTAAASRSSEAHRFRPARLPAGAASTPAATPPRQCSCSSCSCSLARCLTSGVSEPASPTCCSRASSALCRALISRHRSSVGSRAPGGTALRASRERCACRSASTQRPHSPAATVQKACTVCTRRLAAVEPVAGSLSSDSC